ncbi:MAG TPA: sigma factor-like helix-turn-helix DNA-binding protein [Candidatus Paceibacterota bacterium]|nr:sigma factor-like helix-turn-helix DNA-binding protein [Candidatus Paceibacterota bacterium]
MSTNSQSIKKTVADLLKNTSTRNRDIISRRFGLKTGKKETLESIGASYSITRERVRQIEEATLAQLRAAAQQNVEVARYVALTKDILNESGGIAAERDLFKAFSGQEADTVVNASLVFLLAFSKDLVRVADSDDFNSFWAVDAATLANFKTTTATLAKILEKSGRAIPRVDFLYLIQKHGVPSFSASGKPLSEGEVALAMNVSKNLAQNIFNEVGLASWAEIKPKGVRDKAYIVLKKSKEPKHFSEIAKLINASGFNHKKANVQTVHNELIKDNRFILVGRGLYALSEWGYKAGTVKDVLVDILRTSSKPLPKAALMAKVKDARMVKENTILLNLQDSKTFVKNSDGTYTLRG